MKLFVNGFWSGFIDKSNPVNISFFIRLFELIFLSKIELCEDFTISDILLETIFDNKTYLFDKKWKYTFLYSGETRLNCYYKHYSCVLYGERNHDNIINVPLFVPNLYCSSLLDKFSVRSHKNRIPMKNICAIISNDGGKERNYILEQLEKVFQIDYLGSYKNNAPRIEEQYNSIEFINRLADYKFIVSMENSKGDTYITEKILHGFNSGSIPIYWGSEQVTTYFNNERFINVTNITNIECIKKQIEEIMNDDSKYLEMINKPIFKNNYFGRTIEEIAIDVRNLIKIKPVKLINKVYAISSHIFEPVRYKRLCEMFTNMGLINDNVSFICPTYKQTITDEIMKKHVKYNYVKRLRYLGMKKSEISLFLNYRAVLENIRNNYSNGIFLILESDAFQTGRTVCEFNDFVNEMYKKINYWDLIHIGSDGNNNSYFSKPYCDCILPYRDSPKNKLPETYIEDISCSTDKFRLVRKFHTRCTDSFIWTYKGVLKFLEYMDHNEYYDAPFDYYMTNFFENCLDFKHYWSLDTFFIQGSNNGLDISTIQTDTD
jgi:hypothetical protein